MPLCGPKLSLCGVVLSIWGIIQLSIMGVFFYINSVALIEDINLEESYSSMDRLRTDMDKGYQQNALNCWIAGNPRYWRANVSAIRDLMFCLDIVALSKKW